MNGALEIAPSASALVAEMDRVGVNRCLAGAVNAPVAGAEAANQWLAAQLDEEQSGRLSGVWSFLPDCCGEFPSGQKLLSAMKKHRIRALRLLPSAHRWVCRRAAAGRQFAELAEHRIPLLAGVSEFGSWDKIYEFAETFADNILIITDCGVWGCDRQVRPLLSQFERVYFALGDYWNAGGLAELVKHAGHRKILFGSGYPRCNHGQSMLMLRHAEITETAKRAIAGGNLEHLLGEVQW
ncbi:MAG: amidohydrolase family protein [Victivallaceae bacterium]